MAEQELEPSRKFKGVWIERSLWLNKNLSWLEKCVIAEIDSLSTLENPCTASNEYLAMMFDVSEGRMANIISKLRKLKWLQTDSFDGRRRTLITAFTRSEKEPDVKADLTKSVNAESTESVNAEAAPYKSITKQIAKRERRSKKHVVESLTPLVQTRMAFLEKWTAAYREATGLVGQKKFNAVACSEVEAFLENDFLDEEIWRVAKRAWTNNTKNNFWSQNANSVLSFCRNYSNIRKEVNGIGQERGQIHEGLSSKLL